MNLTDFERIKKKIVLLVKSYNNRFEWIRNKNVMFMNLIEIDPEWLRKKAIMFVQSNNKRF